MITTQATPFTKEQIKVLGTQFEVYIKTVIDVENKVCSAGMDLHYEGEQILLTQGSLHGNIWGGGIDLTTKDIDYNSFINIRPNDGNPKNEIQSEKIKAKYLKLTKYFFQEIL
ncbi:hypothetical protein KBD69_03440 [Candidatus Woesebacteria bacterium]|nr:hypothetical protein [Candidatus Woesebacteria bacterium]